MAGESEYQDQQARGYNWDYWGLKHNKRYWSWKDYKNMGREGGFEYRLIKNQLQYRKLYPDQKPGKWTYVWNLEYWQTCFRIIPV